MARMVGELASRQALSQEVVEGVSERTGGVPLFVEEVTRLLLERGAAASLPTIPPRFSIRSRRGSTGSAKRAKSRRSAPLWGEISPTRCSARCGRIADPDLLSRARQARPTRISSSAEGAGLKRTYRFKHALIQDAAYEGLLKSRRQALHRRAAEALVGQPELAAAEPEVIAHHYTRAGRDELAIPWWGRAGDQALRRSAFQEAMAHLGKAIAMADKAAGPPRRPRFQRRRQVSGSSCRRLCSGRPLVEGLRGG